MYRQISDFIFTNSCIIFQCVVVLQYLYPHVCSYAGVVSRFQLYKQCLEEVRNAEYFSAWRLRFLGYTPKLLLHYMGAHFLVVFIFPMEYPYCFLQRLGLLAVIDSSLLTTSAGCSCPFLMHASLCGVK